jgi:hypothetical protein
LQLRLRSWSVVSCIHTPTPPGSEVGGQGASGLACHILLLGRTMVIPVHISMCW